MELWLTEKSTLYALIAMSNTDTPLSDDSIDAAYRIRSHEKALQLVHHTFYGSLELELFSGFDLRGSESVVALQNRLAREIIPHDIPSPKDLTPLMDIMKENVQGRRVAWHRYVWCEAMSASFLERCHEQSSKNENTSEQFKHQLRLDVRRFLLEPGAAVDFAAFRSHFNVNPCQPTALMQRYDL